MENAKVTHPPNATEGVLGLNLKFASLSCEDYTVCRVRELHIQAKYYKQMSSEKLLVKKKIKKHIALQKLVINKNGQRLSVTAEL